MVRRGYFFFLERRLMGINISFYIYDFSAREGFCAGCNCSPQLLCKKNAALVKENWKYCELWLTLTCA